jgi:SAM-dependent methyltransferase
VKKSVLSGQSPVTATVKSEVSPFDALAIEYDTWFENEGKLIFSTEVKALRKVLPLLPKPWLEVGVGSGRFAKVLGIPTGIDPSPRLLVMARKRGITGFLARGEDKVFLRKTFGTVFIITTLCFVDSPLAVFTEAHRILNVNGKIVLGIVLKDSPWGQFYLEKKRRGHRFYRQAMFYSYGELLEILEQTGFMVDKIVSTLFQKPDKVEVMESPRAGFFSDAGFVVFVAKRVSSISEKVNSEKT